MQQSREWQIDSTGRSWVMKLLQSQETLRILFQTDSGKIERGANTHSPDLVVIERVQCRGHPHEAPAGAFAMVSPCSKEYPRQTQRRNVKRQIRHVSQYRDPAKI